jgi:hypothetical protein
MNSSLSKKKLGKKDYLVYLSLRFFNKSIELIINSTYINNSNISYIQNNELSVYSCPFLRHGSSWRCWVIADAYTLHRKFDKQQTKYLHHIENWSQFQQIFGRIERNIKMKTLYFFLRHFFLLAKLEAPRVY